MKLRYNGEIVWDSPAITKSTCVVDVSYFPFDWQQCNLTFGSWTYNGNQVGSQIRVAGPLLFMHLFIFLALRKQVFKFDILCCSNLE